MAQLGRTDLDMPEWQVYLNRGERNHNQSNLLNYSQHSATFIHPRVDSLPPHSWGFFTDVVLARPGLGTIARVHTDRHPSSLQLLHTSYSSKDAMESKVVS